MPTYSIKDYELFSQAKDDIKGLVEKVDDGSDVLSKSQQILTNEAIFKGPAADECVEPMKECITNFKNISTGYTTVTRNLTNTEQAYKSGDKAAAEQYMNKAVFAKITVGAAVGNTAMNASKYKGIYTGDTVAYTTELPDNLSQSGYLVTGYSSRGFEYTDGSSAKAEGTAAQKAVHDLYAADGGRYKNDISVLNVDGQDRYLVAVSGTYGKVGDKINVHLKNGETVPCVIADMKSANDSNYTKYGHKQNNGSTNVLEFEVNINALKEKGNPNTKGWGLEWDSSSDVASIDNCGSIIE